MKNCIEHNKELKGPNKAGKYWHVIDYDKGEFCNKTEEEYNAIPDNNETTGGGGEEVREPVDQYVSTQSQPDWDKIAEGKVRHGVAIAFLEKYGEELNSTVKTSINNWVKFIMTGE